MEKKKKAKKKDSALPEEKKTNGIGKDKILVISMILILVCFAGIFYFLNSRPAEPETTIPEIKTYKSFVFEKYGNAWMTNMRMTDVQTGKVKDLQVMFHFTPDQVEYIPTEKNIRNDTTTPYIFMNVPRIYITTEPDYPSTVILGGVEIAKILAHFYGKEVKSGLTRATNNTQTSVITCDDLNSTQRVIYLKIGNETSIKSESGCIVVQGKTPIEVVMASERLAYELLKIL